MTAELISRCKPQISKHVEILGFTEKNIKEYARSVFSSPQLENFLEYIYSTPILHSMMYVPINTVIVAEIYQQNANSNQLIPRTMTQLYDALTHALLRRHMVDNGILKDTCRIPQTLQALPGSLYETFRQVCKTSFSGIYNQKLTWSELPDDYDHLGLMSKESSLHVDTGCEVSYSFLHLTLQEYLAAFHVSLLPHDDQVQIFKECGHLPHFHVVWRFLAGLTGFSRIGWNTVWLKYREESPEWLEADYCLQPLYVHCLYESQDTTGALECGSCDTKVGFLPNSISPFDALALSYCIAHSVCKWILDFITAGIACDALKMFVHGLKKQTNIGGHIQALKLGRNQMGLEGIEILSTLPQSILKNVPMLKLYSCDLDSSAFDELSNLIPLMPSLVELDVGENPVIPGGTNRLLQSLFTLLQLQLLDIASVDLGPADINVISKLISPNHGSLLTLKIGDESITSECVELMLINILGPSSLREIDIRSCDLIPHAQVFRKQLMHNKNLQKMKFLWCKMGRDVIVYIAEGLQGNKTVKTLRICHPVVGMYAEGASALARMIQMNQCLEELVIMDDSLNEESVAQLRDSSHSLRVLKLEG